MEHKKLEELVQLYATDELDKKEIEIVENHLLECEECSANYSSMRQLYFAFTENSPKPVEDYVLNQARENLMDKLYSDLETIPEKSNSFFDKLIEFISTPSRFAFSGVSLIILGFIISRIFVQDPAIISSGQSIDNLDLNKVDIANVKFLPAGASEDEVEILYNDMSHSVYRGKMSDQNVQALLARAVVAGNNPGIRIKSLNAITQKTESKPLDLNVKTALIDALKLDENDGVRQQSLNVLINYPNDKDIQDALLFVLANDKNPGLRVMAINALGKLKTNDSKIPDNIYNVLNDKAQSDDNSFIRLRAANLIEGESK